MSKVSILTPVYNNKTDILNAIASVVNQTYKNWEMIVVDDCSTDGTYELVENFIKENKYDNIILLKNKINCGLFVSLNEAINRSSGDYICRIDSDDFIIPEYFELCVGILDKNPEIVAVNSRSKREFKTAIFGNIGLFYRKKIIIETIGYYDSVRFAADSEFKERMYKLYKKQIYILKVTTYYAKHREQSLKTSVATSKPKIRLAYVKKYRKWHNTSKNLFMPYPLIKRPFPVNKIMLS